MAMISCPIASAGRANGASEGFWFIFVALRWNVKWAVKRSRMSPGFTTVGREKKKKNPSRLGEKVLELCKMHNVDGFWRSLERANIFHMQQVRSIKKKDSIYRSLYRKGSRVQSNQKCCLTSTTACYLVNILFHIYHISNSLDGFLIHIWSWLGGE